MLLWVNIADTLFSAGLALAALGVRERGAVIDVVGLHDDPDYYRCTVRGSGIFASKVVRLLGPRKAAEIGRKEYAGVIGSSAFACLGRHCFEPATDPVQLEG